MPNDTTKVNVPTSYYSENNLYKLWRFAKDGLTTLRIIYDHPAEFSSRHFILELGVKITYLKMVLIWILCLDV